MRPATASRIMLWSVSCAGGSSALLVEIDLATTPRDAVAHCVLSPPESLGEGNRRDFSSSRHTYPAIAQRVSSILFVESSTVHRCRRTQERISDNKEPMRHQETIKPQYAFELYEQHLDLFGFTARFAVSGASETSAHIPHVLADAARVETAISWSGGPELPQKVALFLIENFNPLITPPTLCRVA